MIAELNDTLCLRIAALLEQGPLSGYELRHGLGVGASASATVQSRLHRLEVANIVDLTDLEGQAPVEDGFDDGESWLATLVDADDPLRRLLLRQLRRCHPEPAVFREDSMRLRAYMSRWPDAEWGAPDPTADRRSYLSAADAAYDDDFVAAE